MIRVRSLDPASTEAFDSVAGVILAGSYQWSAAAFDALMPRPLLPVAEQPIIEHVLTWLGNAHINTAALCANGSTDTLRQHFSKRQDIAVNLAYHEDRTPRGAAGCVKDAGKKLGASTLIVADGTSIPVVDIERLLARHWETRAAMTIVAHEQIRRDGCRTLRPVGVYVMEREILDLVPATSFQDLKETLIPKLHRDGRHIEVFTVTETSPHVLNAATYLSANHWMVNRLAGHFGGSETKSPAPLAAPTAWVDPDATIVGPVVLGPGVRVTGDATIVGPSVIGTGTVIGAGAVVARSVMWSGCSIGERAFVDQCVLTDNARVGSDSLCTGVVRLAAPERHGGVSSFFAARRATPPKALPKPALS